jgi:hypothetical protein
VHLDLKYHGLSLHTSLQNLELISVSKPRVAYLEYYMKTKFLEDFKSKIMNWPKMFENVHLGFPLLLLWGMMNGDERIS